MRTEKIKIGIIGTGKFAREYYFPACKNNANVEIYAIANRSHEKALEIAEEYQIDFDHVFTGDDSWYRLLENGKVDAVIISTPNFLHAPITVAAAQRGIHILVEKPMATSSEEAFEMIQSAQDNNVILMVAFPQRFMPAFEKAKEIIDQGIIGKIQTIQSTFGHSGPEIWNPSGKWYFETSKSSGGVLLDLGSHQVDTISWLIGSNITEVHAFTSTLRESISVEDNSCLSFKFNNGVMGFILSSWTIQPTMVNHLRVYGDCGFLHLEHKCLRVETMAESFIRYDLPSRGHDAKVISINKLIYNFAQSVLSKDVPSISSNDGLKSLSVILAAYRSLSTNSLIAVG